MNQSASPRPFSPAPWRLRTVMWPLAFALPLSATACGDSTDSGPSADANGRASIDAASAIDASPNADAAATSFSISITSVTAVANCEPVVDEDPLDLQLEIAYDNTAGSATARADIATTLLHWTDDDQPPDTQAIVLSPTGSGDVPAGQVTRLAHSKRMAIDNLANDCGYCGGAVTVEIDFDVADSEAAYSARVSSASTPLICLF